MAERLEDFLLFLEFVGISPENAVTDGETWIGYRHTDKKELLGRNWMLAGGAVTPKVKLLDFLDKKKFAILSTKHLLKKINANEYIRLDIYDRKFKVDCPEFSCTLKLYGNSMKLRKGWYRSVELLNPEGDFRIFVSDVKFKNLAREEHTNAVLKFTFQKHRVGFWKDREKMLP